MLKSLLNSFKYAFCGIVSSVIRERNLRIHIVAASYVLWFSRFYELTKIEYAILFLVIAFVIVSELINTAIEAAVDILSPSDNANAKISKDAASGAVLFSAICAIAVGIIFFADKVVLLEIIEYFKLRLIRPVILVLSLIISIIFIFFLFKSKDQVNMKEKQINGE